MVGIDYSGRFLNAAMDIQSGKDVKFGGDKVASFPDGENVDTTKVVFKQV